MPDEQETEGLDMGRVRPQDAIAAIAGVQFFEVIKVLQALSIYSAVSSNGELEDHIDRLIYRCVEVGADADGYSIPPSEQDRVECQKMLDHIERLGPVYGGTPSEIRRKDKASWVL